MLIIMFFQAIQLICIFVVLVLLIKQEYGKDKGTRIAQESKKTENSAVPHVASSDRKTPESEPVSGENDAKTELENEEPIDVQGEK